MKIVKSLLIRLASYKGNQWFWKKTFSLFLVNEYVKNIPTFSQRDLSSCSCGCFSASFKSSSSLTSLFAALPSFSNSFKSTTVIIPPKTANRALRKISSQENISVRCCLQSYDLSWRDKSRKQIRLSSSAFSCFLPQPMTDVTQWKYEIRK